MIPLLVTVPVLSGARAEFTIKSPALVNVDELLNRPIELIWPQALLVKMPALTSPKEATVEFAPTMMFPELVNVPDVSLEIPISARSMLICPPELLFKVPMLYKPVSRVLAIEPMVMVPLLCTVPSLPKEKEPEQ